MSMTESMAPLVPRSAFSRFKTSSGCSNILNERRNCFLGRWFGIDGFRTWPVIGEPAPRSCPAAPEKECFSLGGPKAPCVCGFAVNGFFCCGGEDAKHSSADINDGGGNEDSLLKLKGGKGGRRFSALLFFISTEVEWTLVRDSEDLKIGLLRLYNRLEVMTENLDELTQEVAMLLRTSPLARALELRI